jgi:farnesyl diphosphate synthase
MSDFAGWMHARKERIERALEALLPPATLSPTRLHEAMRYAVLGGGKRVRPMLAFAAGELASANPQRVERVAAAVELIHVYSLVHDDLPCMDDDVLRRGRATCHVAFDEATALLVGDALQTLAFHVLAEHPLAQEATHLEMIRILATAAGSRGMAGGQAIDLESTGRELSLPELEIMHIHKTGELIRAATLLGARCGEGLRADEIERLDRFSKFTGLAFQVIDDVLDAESDTATLGKTAGKDAHQNKPTYVSLLGASRARAFAGELRTQALQALDGFGERAQRLRELIDFIVLRIH